MAGIRDVIQASQVRPVDVGRSVGTGAQTAMTLQDLAARKQATEERNLLRDLARRGDFTRPGAARDEFLAGYRQVNPGGSVDLMKMLREMDKDKLAQHQAEAPIMSKLLAQVNSQETLDLMRDQATRMGMDASDWPAVFNLGQINIARQAYGLVSRMAPMEVGAGATLYDPASEEPIYTAPSRPGRLTERDKLRQDLTAQGYSDEQIRNFMINRDRYQFAVDQFGNRVVFDRYENQLVSGPRPGGTPAEGATAGSPGPALAPLGRPGEGGGGAPRTLPPAGVPQNLEEGFEAGTGGSGFLGNIANTITDAFGGGLARPETEQARIALDTLNTRTMLQMTVAMPGRPSNLIRERLEGLAVTPGSLFQGDERSLERLRQTRGVIAQEMSRLQDVLDNPAGYQAKDLSAARANQSQLRDLYGVYGHIIDNWRPGTAGAPRITNKEQRDRLPPGTRYVAPDGSVRIKR